MDRDRIHKALDSLVYLPHLKEKAMHAAISPVGKNAGGKGRVWDRGDLFRRLQTYKPATWFCKPEAISPVECARRGWLNTGPDLLTCEFCKAKVSCPIPPKLLPEEARETAVRFAQQLTDAHDAACPWRTNCCEAALLQFPPLTQEATCLDFRTREASLQQLVCLPPLSQEAYQKMATTHQQALDQLLLNGPSAAIRRPERQEGWQQGGTGASSSAPNGDRQYQEPARPSDGNCTVLHGEPERQRLQPPQSDGSEKAELCVEAVRSEILEKLGRGPAPWNSEAYEVRLRLLALCGWDLKVVAAAAAGDEAAGSSNDGCASSSRDAVPPRAHGSAAVQPLRYLEGGQLGAHVRPECSALLCTLCGAKAGLWTFFPQCRPQVQTAPPRSGRAALLEGPSSRQGALLTERNIAGGCLSSPTVAVPGPFGSSHSSEPPLFGASTNYSAILSSDSGNVAEGSPATQQPALDRAGSEAAEAAAEQKEASIAGGPFRATPAADSSAATPIFGLVGLQQSASRVAQAEQAAHELQLTAEDSAKRRKTPWGQGNDTRGAEAGGEGRPPEKRSRRTMDGAGEGVGSGNASSSSPQELPSGAAKPPAGVPTASATLLQGPFSSQLQYCSTEALQSYCNMEAVPLDPLALHRRFCPWVNQAQHAQQPRGSADREGQPDRCGWKWCLQQLVPGVDDAGSLLLSSQSGEGGKQWEPAKLLRAVLRRVDVHN